MLHFAGYDSPVGKLLLQSNGTALTGLQPGRNTQEVSSEDDVLKNTKQWLDSYFRGEDSKVEIPLAPEGTAFQQLIWQLLLEIPKGQTRTYGELAREASRRMGKETMSAQAVGQAVGRNPISILIPCHRVIGAKGKLTGYAWGLEMKQWLLRQEGWSGGNDRKER